MTAASIGEVMACLVRVPTEVVKQRMQAGQNHSLRDTIRTTLQREGPSGFYKGFGTTLLREIPFAFIQFPIYEQMKTSLARYHEREVRSYEAALCGSIAGAFAAAATTPLDVLKTRLMLNTQVGVAGAVGPVLPSSIFCHIVRYIIVSLLVFTTHLLSHSHFHPRVLLCARICDCQLPDYSYSYPYSYSLLCFI